jgi:hypothetical protein
VTIRVLLADDQALVRGRCPLAWCSWSRRSAARDGGTVADIARIRAQAVLVAEQRGWLEQRPVAERVR